MTVRIQIRDAKIPVQLGCTGEERAYPQIVTMQVGIALVDEKSLRSDDLSDTIDYMKVLATLKEVSARKEYKLLEHLGECIVQEIFSLSNIVAEVRIDIEKYIAPNTSGVAVCIVRER